MSLSQETWKLIPGFEGYYEVSDQGRVRSLDRTIFHPHSKKVRLSGRVLSRYIQSDQWCDRHVVGLCRDGKPRTRLVAHLVLEAFVGPRPEGYEVAHNNGDSLDDSLTNLRYATKSENNRDQVRHGTHPEARKTHCPYGHPLTAPNLKPNGVGRQCLACSRARNNYHHAKRTGRELDFMAAADDHYNRIVEAHERAVRSSVDVPVPAGS